MGNRCAIQVGDLVSRPQPCVQIMLKAYDVLCIQKAVLQLGKSQSKAMVHLIRDICTDCSWCSVWSQREGTKMRNRTPSGCCSRA